MQTHTCSDICSDLCIHAHKHWAVDLITEGMLTCQLDNRNSFNCDLLGLCSTQRSFKFNQTLSVFSATLLVYRREDLKTCLL